MIYLKNPLCLGIEESEYKEMQSLGGMRQKHFEKNEIILSAGEYQPDFVCGACRITIGGKTFSEKCSLLMILFII